MANSSVVAPSSAFSLALQKLRQQPLTTSPTQYLDPDALRELELAQLAAPSASARTRKTKVQGALENIYNPNKPKAMEIGNFEPAQMAVRDIMDAMNKVDSIATPILAKSPTKDLINFNSVRKTPSYVPPHKRPSAQSGVRNVLANMNSNPPLPVPLPPANPHKRPSAQSGVRNVLANMNSKPPLPSRFPLPESAPPKSNAGKLLEDMPVIRVSPPKSNARKLLENMPGPRTTLPLQEGPLHNSGCSDPHCPYYLVDHPTRPTRPRMTLPLQESGRTKVLEVIPLKRAPSKRTTSKAATTKRRTAARQKTVKARRVVSVKRKSAPKRKAKVAPKKRKTTKKSKIVKSRALSKARSAALIRSATERSDIGRIGTLTPASRFTAVDPQGSTLEIIKSTRRGNKVVKAVKPAPSDKIKISRGSKYGEADVDLVKCGGRGKKCTTKHIADVNPSEKIVIKDKKNESEIYSAINTRQNPFKGARITIYQNKKGGKRNVTMQKKQFISPN